MDDSVLTAADYKNAGNRLCASHRYDEAIGFYSKAINKNPREPLFFSNRALCYLKLKQHSLAIQDCRHALELDPNLLKAHFFMGTALNESGLHDEALKYLQRAHDLAKEKCLNYGDEITYQIRLAKRRRWINMDEAGARLDDELFDYLFKLINRDKGDQVKQIADRIGAVSLNQDLNSSACEQKSIHSKHNSDEDAKATSNLTESHHAKDGSPNVVNTGHQQAADCNTKSDIYINRLKTIFNQLKLQRQKREVPDHLCGKISFEIMRDPVITPSGITYDRKNIEEHLYRVGFFDPITRQPLTASDLIPNLAMKEVIDAYLSENEWANHC